MIINKIKRVRDYKNSLYIYHIEFVIEGMIFR